MTTSSGSHRTADTMKCGTQAHTWDFSQFSEMTTKGLETTKKHVLNFKIMITLEVK